MSYDYSRDRPLAESVLRRLCVGANVEGIRFGVIPQLLIGHPELARATGGQVYLNLASTWRVYPQRPPAFPRGEDQLEELDDEEDLRRLCGLRKTAIHNIELGIDAPDLLITFIDGRVFFLNGRHEQYETWQFGIAYAPRVGTLVVACPGNQIAVWELPDHIPVGPAV